MPLLQTINTDVICLGCPTVASRNPFEISLANFTVANGANALARPVGNGLVESGALQRGTVKQTNLSLDTATGQWLQRNFSSMFITYN
jgi:alkaline phosphatase D